MRWFNDTIFKLRPIEEGINTDFGNEICIEEAESVFNLDVAYGWNYYKITDLTGIEYFINIDTLYCSWNQLTSIDLSYNFINKLSPTSELAEAKKQHLP